MAFKDRLKEARASAGLTQLQLAELMGIGKSTLSGYELGTSEPDISKITKMMDILKVDANYLWQDEMKENDELNTYERLHIKKYRELDTHGKEMVDMVLDKEHERGRKVNILDNVEFSMSLIEAPLYLHPASAGTGEYLTDDYIESTIMIPSDKKCDFLIKVSGDSMQPLYNDGDRVRVMEQDTLNVGEVGVFIVDNQSYIKKLGNNELISVNPNYENIKLDEDQHIKVVGKVVGKL